MRQKRLTIHLAALLIAILCRAEETVVTTEGRLIRGTVKAVGSALKVEALAHRRDFYLSPVLVAERKIDTSIKEPEPSFAFHADLTGGKKKGTIAPVVEGLRWNEWQMDGTASVSLRDPALGQLEFRVVISRVTPLQVEVQGIEYDWVRTFSGDKLGGLLLHLVADQVRRNPSAQNWLKLATFMRLRGDLEQVELALKEALKSGTPAEVEACAAERSKLEFDKFVQHLSKLEKQWGSGRVEDIFHEAERLEVPPALKAANSIQFNSLVSRTAELKKKADRHREVKAALARRNLELPVLFPEQMDRLERILQQGPDRVDPKWIPDLCKEWAAGFACAKWDGAHFQEAVRLAPLIETYFAQGDVKQTEALANELKNSKLLPEIKLSLLRHASRYAEAPPETVNGWKRIEFKLPGTAESFHYFISVPESYRPQKATPVLVALHGQTSTAEIMRNFWGEHAAREGWILISPEYIYGRKSGYLFSSQEHQAVIGAVRNAARFLNIDSDRVFLTGHSQGGHAAWDMGAAHAGVFAAVVPIIGAPIMPEHWANFKDTAVYAIDGSLDGNAPQMNRRGIEALARMRTDARYVEYIDRGHEGFGEEYDSVCSWLSARQRPSCSKINLVAFRLEERRRRWVEILNTKSPLTERLAGVINATTVEGEIKPNNQIELKTSNATRLRVLMPAGQVDLSKPVTINVNGRTSWKGTLQMNWNLVLRECLTRADRSDIFQAEVLLEVR
jgi:dienelactone hydrolase